MNKTIQDIIKFWRYLRNLLKSNGDEFRLSRKQQLLLGYSVIRNMVKNTIAQATNDAFMQELYCNEGALNVGDNDVHDLELDNHSSDSLLLNNQIESKELAAKQQRISKQGATQGLCRSLETLSKQQTNGNESAINKQRKSKQTAMKYQTKGNEPTMNKQTKTKENRSGSINSDFFLTKLTPTSKFLRLGFDLASGFHRLQCMKSRRKVEQNPSGGRKRGEEKNKIVSRSLLDVANSKSKHFLEGNRYIHAFNPLRIFFYLRPSFHHMCTVPLPSLHQEKGGAGVLQVLRSYRETYYRGKRRLKESPNKIRTDGLAFFMIFMKIVLAKIGLAVRSVYGLFTNALLKWYRKGTGDVLESYQIGTKASSLVANLKATVGEALYSNGRRVDQASVMRCICIDKAWIVRKMVPVYTLLTHYQRFIPASSILDLYAKGASFQISVFKYLKILSWVKMCFCFSSPVNRLKLPLNNMLSSVHDAVSELVVYEFRKLMGISFNALKNIRIYSLLVLMFYMFSLSAQTPRKDSGADGLSHLMALKPGDKIPDAVWNQTLELNYFDGKKKTIKFSDLKGKLIILDFWSTGCPACIAGMPKFELIQNRFDQDAIVIFVNSKRNKDTPEKIEARFKKYKADHNYSPSLPTLLDDTIFTALFEHNSIPRSAIINKRGEFIGTSYSDNLSDRNISKMIKDGILPFQSMGNIINNKFENIPLLADTAGFDYMSVLSGFRVNYNPIYPNVHYINGQTLYQVGNYALRLMYQHAFLDEIKDSESKNYVFDPNVDEMSIKKLFDLQNQKYWYQYFSKDSIAQQVVHEHFRKSLIDNFHLDVVRKNEEIGVYNLKIDLRDNALLTKGGMPIFWVYEGNRNLVIQNTNLNGIANFLRPYLDQPIVIEDPYGQHVDLILPGNFIDLTVSERIALLKSKGIILNYEKRKMEFPYFYLSAK